MFVIETIICEKSLADNLDDTLRLAKVIKDTGILCQMGFQRRFDPPYTETEQMIQEGAIGKPVYFCAFSCDPFPPPPWVCDPNKGGGLNRADLTICSTSKGISKPQTFLPQGKLPQFHTVFRTSLRGGNAGFCRLRNRKQNSEKTRKHK